MTVRIVIVNRNGALLLGSCLDDIGRQTWRDFAVTIVDNGSTDGSRSLASGTPYALDWVQLDRNVGFAAACNIAVRRATEPFVVLLNNDVRVPPEWLERVVARLQGVDKPAAVGSLVLNDSAERIQSAGDYVTDAGHLFAHGEGRLPDEIDIPAAPTAVTAAAAAFRRDALVCIGLFDERFFAYCEDVDVCLRLRLAGEHVALERDAVVRHVGGATSAGRREFERLSVRNQLLLALGTWPSHLLRRYGHRLLVTTAGDLVEHARRHGAVSALRIVGSWAAAVPHVVGKRRTVRRVTCDPHALDDHLVHAPLGPRGRWHSLHFPSQSALLLG